MVGHIDSVLHTIDNLQTLYIRAHLYPVRRSLVCYVVMTLIKVIGHPVDEKQRYIVAIKG